MRQRRGFSGHPGVPMASMLTVLMFIAAAGGNRPWWVPIVFSLVWWVPVVISGLELIEVDDD